MIGFDVEFIEILVYFSFFLLIKIQHIEHMIESHSISTVYSPVCNLNKGQRKYYKWIYAYKDLQIPFPFAFYAMHPNHTIKWNCNRPQFYSLFTWISLPFFLYEMFMAEKILLQSWFWFWCYAISVRANGFIRSRKYTRFSHQ